MSRIGKQLINIPEKTEVTISDKEVVVKGPLGELKRKLHPEVSVKKEDNNITITPSSETGLAGALWGTYASHIINMINGVNKPFEKKLIIEGVGYRAEVKGKNLVMKLGFSHDVIMPVPEGLTVTVEKNTITVSGIDKELVGGFSAVIRSKKKPEPYKGKGIRYDGEVIRRKQGKKTA